MLKLELYLLFLNNSTGSPRPYGGPPDSSPYGLMYNNMQHSSGTPGDYYSRNTTGKGDHQTKQIKNIIHTYSHISTTPPLAKFHQTTHNIILYVTKCMFIVVLGDHHVAVIKLRSKYCDFVSYSFLRTMDEEIRSFFWQIWVGGNNKKKTLSVLRKEMD